MASGRLKKAEQQIVDVAATQCLETVIPALHAIEHVMADHIIPAVPAHLAEHTIRAFMKRLGNELFVEAEIARLTLADAGE